MSSRRFRNSGRKCFFTSFITLSLTPGASTPVLRSVPRSRYSLPRLDVMMISLRRDSVQTVSVKLFRNEHSRVGEVDGAPFAVGQAAIIQHLQEHVPHLRMCLLDFVEQNHRVGLAAHSFRQLTALIMA